MLKTLLIGIDQHTNFLSVATLEGNDLQMPCFTQEATHVPLHHQFVSAVGYRSASKCRVRLDHRTATFEEHADHVYCRLNCVPARTCPGASVHGEWMLERSQARTAKRDRLAGSLRGNQSRGSCACRK